MKKVIFLLLDGARNDVLESLINNGSMPNLKSIIDDGGSFSTAVTVFPQRRQRPEAAFRGRLPGVQPPLPVEVHLGLGCGWGDDPEEVHGGQPCAVCRPP